MRDRSSSKVFGRKLATAALGSALLGCSAVGVAPPPEPPALPRALDMRHGELLYQTYCVACHTSQAHWRDNSIVEDWSDVLEQVDRWQRNAGQHWPPSDVADVSAYLNILYYKMPCAVPGCRGDVTSIFERDPAYQLSGLAAP
jgi:mono/diheme cytochrome c family protein